MSTEDYERMQEDRGNILNYKGSRIILEEQEVEQKKYTLQRIEYKKEDIFFSIQKIPSELYLSRKGLKGRELERALKEVENEQLFYVEFKEENKRDLMKKYFENKDMDRAVSYMSFDISKDFFLIKENGDTLKADYTTYERTYHVSPFERILLGFSPVQKEEAVKVVYTDQLFAKGAMTFSFAPNSYLENNIKNPS